MIPTATYRLQINKDFPLSEVKKILPYLKKLGVSTIYASPVFEARPGSTHGYDVVNPLKVSEEIGGEELLRQVIAEAKELGLDWLQDIVPNHMAFDQRNLLLIDALEKGQDSEFYEYFDIDWNHPDYNGKMMAPFLGQPLKKSLQAGEIQLKQQNGSFFFAYYDFRFPLSWRSYPLLIKKLLQNEKLKKSSLADDVWDIREEMESAGEANILQRSKDILQKSSQNKDVQQVLEELNEDKDFLLEMLDLQHFQFSYWKETEETINYRRFFTINDLLCTRAEDASVFRHFHQSIKKFTDQKLFTGLRVDHVDGLQNPQHYLQHLRELAGDDCYLIVEKILEHDEQLPREWPVQGTSGYDMLALLNQLFTSHEKEPDWTRSVQEIARQHVNLDELRFHKKLYLLKNRMLGEWRNLFRQLKELLPDADNNHFVALGYWMCAFPVYRSYICRLEVQWHDVEVVQKAFRRACRISPDLEQALEQVRGRLFESPGKVRDEKALKFLMRMQQFTGPLMAKGIEDTLFYNYNRFIGNNEVGDDPAIFGKRLSQLHSQMQHRQKTWPHSINATATHDTKRGEDARMRLNALSEIPEEWEEAVRHWQKENKPHKKEFEGRLMPDVNDEYFIYQALLGGFPMNGECDETFLQRFTDYMEKVLREAKVHSNWSQPNEKYEQAVTNFISNILGSNEFIERFRPLFKKTSHFGALYSLGQALLKITLPGVPDIYRGSETWDFSFVDPDNRRPVDFGYREKTLQAFSESAEVDFRQMFNRKEDGSIKLYVVHRALQQRQQFRELFTNGAYVPLEVSGGRQKNVIAFARHHLGKYAIIVVPRLLQSFLKEEELPLGNVWDDIAISLPGELKDIGLKDAFTGKVHVAGEKLQLKEALTEFPVALLTSTQ